MINMLSNKLTHIILNLSKVVLNADCQELLKQYAQNVQKILTHQIVGTIVQ